MNWELHIIAICLCQVEEIMICSCQGVVTDIWWDQMLKHTHFHIAIYVQKQLLVNLSVSIVGSQRNLTITILYFMSKEIISHFRGGVYHQLYLLFWGRYFHQAVVQPHRVKKPIRRLSTQYVYLTFMGSGLPWKFL